MLPSNIRTRSTLHTVYWRVTEPQLRLLSHIDWAASQYYPMLRKFFDTFFEGDFLNRGKDIYLDHYKEIKSLVPPEQLLEYKISQRWGPLCDFLDQDIPYGVPFPRGNDADTFIKRSRARNQKQMLNVGLWLLVYGGAVVVVLFMIGICITDIFRCFKVVHHT